MHKSFFQSSVSILALAASVAGFVTHAHADDRTATYQDTRMERMRGDTEYARIQKNRALDRKEAALEKASLSGLGGSPDNIENLAQKYADKPDDAMVAIGYASALSANRDFKGAEKVLRSYADNTSSPAIFKTEMAAVQLGLGNDKKAEKYAQKAVIEDPGQTRAYQYLGIALDSRGEYKKAEKAFRKGLENWSGDPVPIMNNLALNLASQGHFDESLDVLERAKKLAPDRIEVERNLRIIRALQESFNYKPE